MVPRRPPRSCRWTAPVGWRAPGEALASNPHTVDAAPSPLAWIHNRGEPLPLYIPYYNKAAVLTCAASGVSLVSGIGASRPGAGRLSSAAQAVQYSRMHPPHNSGKTRQIAGNATVKPCALFCCVGGINCINGAKRAVNACMQLYCNIAK